MCVGIIGAVASAAGSLFGALQQSQAANANAKAVRNQQIAEQQKATFEKGRHRERTKRILASNATVINASGISSEGSPSEVVFDNVAESALDRAAIQYNADVAINNLEAKRREFKRKGSSALVGGGIGALAPIIKSSGTFLKGPFV